MLKLSSLYQNICKKNYLLGVFFTYPIIYLLIVGLLLHIDNTLLDLYENILFTSLVFTSSFLISKNKAKVYYQIFIYILLMSLFWFETAYLYLYSNRISKSTVFILVETNLSETKEFIDMYFDKYLLLITISFLLPIILFVFFILKSNKTTEKQETPKIKSLKINRKNFELKNKFIYTIIISLIFIILWKTNLLLFNTPYLVFNSYREYKEEMLRFENLELNKSVNFSSVKASQTKEQTCVVIIGESTTRHHMSLYGYKRKTNPLLEKIKDQLYVYKDVVSPHSHTISSLGKVLTCGNYENPEEKYTGSIIQLFNKATYNTYWISNQRPLGTHETFITRISNAADKRYFLNTAYNAHNSPYDGKILIPLKKILSQKSDRKIIFIHLLGTHTDYNKRYPEKFTEFLDTINGEYNSKKAIETVNHYDNAVLYNDFVVSEIINNVRETNTNSFVMYFSDHGDDVFEVNNFAGHHEEDGTKPMFDIPFVLWCSDKFKANIRNRKPSLVFDTERKYMIDDLIYSISDIAGVSYSEFINKRSLFSQDFVFRKRLISDSIDYDKKKW